MFRIVLDLEIFGSEYNHLNIWNRRHATKRFDTQFNHTCTQTAFSVVCRRALVSEFIKFSAVRGWVPVVRDQLRCLDGMCPLSGPRCGPPQP